jgi:hypothetical protein
MDRLVDRNSLYRTVQNAARFLYQGGILTEDDQDLLVDHILNHQNRYKGFLFYPTILEREDGIRLISGETPRTRLLANNSVELETLRLLALLGQERASVLEVFSEADLRLKEQCFAGVCLTGECPAASIAYLRYLTARDPYQYAAEIRHGLEIVKQNRSGNGRWKKFPFRFTLLWLTDLPLDFSGEELEYTRGEKEITRAAV